MNVDSNSPGKNGLIYAGFNQDQGLSITTDLLMPNKSRVVFTIFI